MTTAILTVSVLLVVNSALSNCSTLDGTQPCSGRMCNPSTRSIAPPAASEEDLIKEAKCFAACADKLSTYFSRKEDSKLPSTPLGEHWSVITDKTSLDSDCKMYQQLSDYKRGCLISARNPTWSDEKCRDECTDFCISQCGATDCSNHTYSDSNCAVKCRRPICRKGCEMLDSMVDQTNTTVVTTNATNLDLYRIRSANGGQYSTVFTLATPNDEGSGENENRSFVSFIVRTVTSNGTHYTWQFTPGDRIDLEYATCKMVNISYALVSKDSISDYSPPLVQCVFGGYPEQLHGEDISFIYTEDLRFRKHAMVNISWSRPRGYQTIERYQITVFSDPEVVDSCGGFINTYNIFQKDANSYLLRSKHENDVPVFGCHYLINLYAYPNSNPAQTAMVPMWPAPHMEMQCGRQFHPNGTITVFAKLMLPDSPGLIEAIDKFIAIPTLIDIANQPAPPIDDTYSQITVYTHANITEYLLSVNGLQPRIDPDLRYQIYTEAVKNHEYEWRSVPSSVRCHVAAHSEPPCPINASSISISQLMFTDKILNISYRWHPPSIPNGRIERYQSRIAAEPLPPDQDSQPMHLAFLKAIDQVDHTNDSIITERIFQIETVSCLYLQMRSYNGYFWSNWSIPVPLSKHHKLDPHCTGLPTSIVSSLPAVPMTAQPAPSEGHSPPSFVYGVIAACVVVLLIIGFLCPVMVILCRRYHRRNRYLASFKDANDNPMYTKRETDELKLHLFEAPVLDEWEIPACDVIINDRLGEGCFGEVYKGMIKGPINNPKVPASLKNVICPTVAIKLLKPSASGLERNDFLQEIDTLKTVSEGNNPHVVNLMGCVTIQEPLCLITEFVKHGNLLSYLHNIRSLVSQRPRAQTDHYPVPLRAQKEASGVGDYADIKRLSVTPSHENPYAELGEVDCVNLLSFAYQIASGMEYLSSLGIIHRDLACRNILVGEGKSLKISDFGMSRLLTTDDVYVKSSRGRQPWKWMAIESITEREFTSASDVWAYGIVLWEISTLGGFPYPTVSNCELLDHLRSGFRLEKPDNCSSEVYDIMTLCWREVPKERPSFSILRAKFDSLISTQQDYMPYIDLEIDAVKPYYLNIPTDADKSSSSEPNEVDDLHKEGGYESIRPLLDSAHDMPRPVSNAYVETPTGMLSVTFPTVNNSHSYESRLSLCSMEQPSSMANPV